MLFELNEPAFIDGQYHPATAQYPTRLSIPDERKDLVSLQWLALDESAKKAQIALRDAKNKAQVELGTKHKLQIVRSNGASMVAVAGGKKVAAGGVVVEGDAQAAPPTVEVGKSNPIGA